MENIDSTYLARLQDYYAENGVLPPYSTIMGIVGMKSKSPVAALVARLKLQGYLESTPEKRLKPGRTVLRASHLRQCARRFSQPGRGHANHDTLTIDEFLVSHPSSTVLVNVKGDSMIDAGILPGDTVIVEKRAVANVGDMVIAIIDNEFTLKTLGKEKERICADPRQSGLSRHPSQGRHGNLRCRRRPVPQVQISRHIHHAHQQLAQCHRACGCRLFLRLL